MRPLRSFSPRLALVLALACGCRATAPTPTDALAAYASALRENRYADAWRLLSASSRQALPYEAFERAAREHPDELRDALAAVDRVDPNAPVTARLELASGEVVTLTEEDGEWHLDPSTLEFYGQHTPRQALRSFVRALERRRWDVLLRLAPRAVVAGLTSAAASAAHAPGQSPPTAADRLRDAWSGAEAERVEQTLRRLREALDQGRHIEEVGDSATMTYGPTAGQSIARLTREDGLWKVEDPD